MLRAMQKTFDRDRHSDFNRVDSAILEKINEIIAINIIPKMGCVTTN
jgi:hypothetical protein